MRKVLSFLVMFFNIDFATARLLTQKQLSSVTNMFIVQETIFNLIQQIKVASTFLFIVIKFSLNYIT